MAVGARSTDIMRQFLIEAVVLTVNGGLVGTAIGVLGAYIFARTSGWPAAIDPFTVMTAILFSAAVGVFFGFYPAYKASRLHPIEALRHE